jgi:predicted acetyltransferase
MLRYYIGHDLLWQDQAFEVAWDGRDNWLIMLGEVPVGFSASVGIAGRCISASCK